jgi:hypothetical protein
LWITFDDLFVVFGIGFSPCSRNTGMRDPDELISSLAGSAFRSRFKLSNSEQFYLEEKSLTVVLQHAETFFRERLSAARPERDGKQTPMRGHPVFVAQHATATCCRKCLENWHHIPQGVPLQEEHIGYMVTVVGRWLEVQRPDSPLSESRPQQQSMLFEEPRD